MEGKGYAHAQKPLPYDIGHLHAQVLRGDPAFAEVDQQINMAFIVACMACLDALLDLIADAVQDVYKRQVYDFPWGEDYEPGKWQIDYADDSVTHLMALINDAEDDYGNKIGTIETAVSMDEFFPDMYRGGERVWSCFVSADGQVAADDRAASESPWKEAAARMAARTEQPPKEMEMKNITLEGEPVIWVSQPVKELSGTYIRVASIKDQMNRLAAYKNQLLLILLVIFLCLALVVNSVVKVLLRKFYHMLLVVRKVQEGDLAQRVSCLLYTSRCV